MKVGIVGAGLQGRRRAQALTREERTMASVVSLKRSEYDDVFPGLAGAIELAGPLPVGSGDSVVIKINMCGSRTPETGTVTHPAVLDALLRYLRESYENLTISVVESDGTTVLADLFIRWLGYMPILEKWGGRWVNLSKQPMVSHSIKGRHLKEVPVAEVFQDAVFITVPKLKTNLLTGITCCLKNQFGCIPIIEKSVYHPYIHDVVTDINTVLRPDFCIIDAIIAMGGVQGPGTGVPVPFGSVICGRDPVAMDALGARILGFRPGSIGYIRKCARVGVGSLRYRLVGDPLPRVDFEVNRLEMSLLRLGAALQRRAQLRVRRSW
jgi:uncharacterized protein (DUF362 family)